MKQSEKGGEKLSIKGEVVFGVFREIITLKRIVEFNCRCRRERKGVLELIRPIKFRHSPGLRNRDGLNSSQRAV